MKNWIEYLKDNAFVIKVAEAWYSSPLIFYTDRPLRANEYCVILFFSPKYLFIWLHWILVAARGIQCLGLGPLHWKGRVLTTGPLGKYLIFLSFANYNICF